jgi:hypothetical protein
MTEWVWSVLKEFRVFTFASIAAIALLALNIGTAQAVPITYSVEGDAWLDRPFGTFTYDASTNTYSNVSIWSSDYYSVADASASTSMALQAIGLLNSVLRLEFDTALDAGGNIGFSGWERGALVWRGYAKRSGEVIGANVPEPSAALLMGLGIAGLLLGRRMRARSS